MIACRSKIWDLSISELRYEEKWGFGIWDLDNWFKSISWKIWDLGVGFDLRFAHQWQEMRIFSIVLFCVLFNCSWTISVTQSIYVTVKLLLLLNFHAKRLKFKSCYSQPCAEVPRSKSHFLCFSTQLPVASDHSWQPTLQELEAPLSPTNTHVIRDRVVSLEISGNFCGIFPEKIRVLFRNNSTENFRKFVV